ncbi:hypothetical protein SAMN04487895_11338 [Paenibacillus sophorae]|uniref:Uncharacterized protein n=1 Tax=Paenibacillus sophorae TaxID=1333845 RepID=A0A1H8T4F3_9BACL|nr:hypothetical protein SAMN04487895_11338 [Paenibacillus sophorae]
MPWKWLPGRFFEGELNFVNVNRSNVFPAPGGMIKQSMQKTEIVQLLVA